MGRVFVTGDIHGPGDIRKLTEERWPQGSELSREDFLVICGDFGLVWSEPPSDDARLWLDWLEGRPWITLFLDGNHENFDLLDSFSVSRWHGGDVQVLPEHPHIIHLMRGQVFDMGEHGRWFCMGGARSQDKEWRTEGRTWWSREMPSAEEYATATRALESHSWQVDYVFTHDCASSRLRHAMPWFLSHPEYEPQTDELTEFLQLVDEHVDKDVLRRWYGGHYHLDTCLIDDKHVVLYQQIVELGDVPAPSTAPTR